MTGKVPFSLEINDRTTICSPTDSQLPAATGNIAETSTLLILSDSLSSVYPPVNPAIVSEISPYKPLSAVFHALNYEFSLEEVFWTVRKH